MFGNVWHYRCRNHPGPWIWGNYIEIYVLANDAENLNIDPQAYIWSKNPDLFQ